jgi:predicted transcriptional regulator
MSALNVRESMWIALDHELLRGLDALARELNVTRHDACRVAMRRGLKVVVATQPSLPGVRR